MNNNNTTNAAVNVNTSIPLITITIGDIGIIHGINGNDSVDINSSVGSVVVVHFSTLFILMA